MRTTMKMTNGNIFFEFIFRPLGVFVSFVGIDKFDMISRLAGNQKQANKKYMANFIVIFRL